jgi:hypothetical protein
MIFSVLALPQIVPAHIDARHLVVVAEAADRPE